MGTSCETMAEYIVWMLAMSDGLIDEALYLSLPTISIDPSVVENVFTFNTGTDTFVFTVAGGKIVSIEMELAAGTEMMPDFFATHLVFEFTYGGFDEIVLPPVE